MDPEILSSNGEFITLTNSEHALHIVAERVVIDFDVPEIHYSLGCIDLEDTRSLNAEVTLLRKDTLYGCRADIELASDEDPTMLMRNLQKNLSGRSTLSSKSVLRISSPDSEFVCTAEAFRKDGVTTLRLNARHAKTSPNISTESLGFEFHPEKPEEVTNVVAAFEEQVAVVANTLHGMYKPGEMYLGEFTFTLPEIATSEQTSETDTDEQLEAPEEYDSFPGFEDLAGIDAAIDRLKAIADDYASPESKALLAEYELTPPQVILLLGPSGVGKTTSVQALAKAMKADYQLVPATCVMESNVGEAAKSLRTIFTGAQELGSENNRQAILFFDEFDGLFGKDAGGNAGVTKQLISELKNILNDFNKTHPNVLVVFATNEISGISEHILRPERIDETIIYTNPDTYGRTQIFELLLGKQATHFAYMSGDEKMQAELEQPDIDLGNLISAREMAELTNGMNGAAITAILNQARLERMREHRRIEHMPPKITPEDLRAQITHHRQTRPNLD